MKKTVSRMKLVIFNSHREPEELWGVQSTSGTGLLKIWETLVECIELSLSGMLSVFPPLRSNSEMSMITWNMSCTFCYVCTPYLVFVIAQTITNGPQLLLLIEDKKLPVQDFVQNDPKSWKSVREYGYLLYHNQWLCCF